MLWGFFKKVVIADRLAVIVNGIYHNPGDKAGVYLLYATYCFAFQIYCDFSGYSDIARGAARVLGYDLMVNFRQPYFSSSISEFWKRWHISLSSWFKDYLYISLGGNRVKKWRWQYNIFIVFLVSGLWHGANWTFVIWGALHGFYMLFAICTAGIRNKISRLLHVDKVRWLKRIWSILITFHLVLFSWIFFRASSLTDALLIIKGLLRIDFSVFDLNLDFWINMWIIVFLLVADFILCICDFRSVLQRTHVIVRWSIYYCLFYAIIFLGEFYSVEFIYFQF